MTTEFFTTGRLLKQSLGDILPVMERADIPALGAAHIHMTSEGVWLTATDRFVIVRTKVYGGVDTLPESHFTAEISFSVAKMLSGIRDVADVVITPDVITVDKDADFTLDSPSNLWGKVLPLLASNLRGEGEQKAWADCGMNGELLRHIEKIYFEPQGEQTTRRFADLSGRVVGIQMPMRWDEACYADRFMEAAKSIEEITTIKEVTS